MKVSQLLKLEKPDFHPVAWMIIIGTFMSRTVFFMTMPFLAIYLDHVKGLPAHIIGVIIGISALVGTFAGFFGGNWSDRIGRFPVMIMSIALWVFVFIGFAVAEQTWMFFLLSALNGLCRATFEPTSQALLADVTPKERRMSVFNARYTAINVGAAIGPLLGAYLGSSQSTTPFFVTAMIYGVYAIMVIALYFRYHHLFQSDQQKGVMLGEAFRVIATDRVFLFFLLGGMVSNMIYAQMETTLPQYMGNAPEFSDGVRLFSYLLVTNAISVLVLQYPLTRFFKQYHPMVAIKIGSVLFGLGMFGFGIFESSVMLFVSMVVFTAGEVLVFLMSNLLIDRIAPAHMRGAYFGAAGFRSIGFSMGPAVGGYLLSFFGYDQGWMVFGVLLILTLMALPFFQIGHHLEKQRPSRDEGETVVSA